MVWRACLIWIRIGEIELADTPSFYETPQIDANGSLEQAYRDTSGNESTRGAGAHRRTRQARSERVATADAQFLRHWGQQGLSAPAAIPGLYLSSHRRTFRFSPEGGSTPKSPRPNLELKKMDQERTDLRSQIALEVKTSQAQLDAAQHEVDVANSG